MAKKVENSDFVKIGDVGVRRSDVQGVHAWRDRDGREIGSVLILQGHTLNSKNTAVDTAIKIIKGEQE